MPLAAFLLATFLSAFLLFQVQPIISRAILPWYGGSPAVWTTCMLFFQVGLLVGYAYAHLLATRLREHPRRQLGIHLALLFVALLILPITPPESLRPTGGEASPVGGILLLLSITVGLPYVVIAASGPLLQHWFGAVAEGRSPYRLYAVSNLGSLLGLLAYPLLVEPRLRLAEQSEGWSLGFGLNALMVGACAWLVVRARPSSPGHARATGAAPPPTAQTPSVAATPWTDRVLWVALPACGSVLLLASTNQMCQDVAVVPFLWVLPLSLYLITFIIAFDGPRWYDRRVWMPLAAVSVYALIHLLSLGFTNPGISVVAQLGIVAAALFTGCMVCHGEMVRLKPPPRDLTAFYLAVSLGGALGGVFVALVAPRLFTSYWELHVGLLALAVLAGVCLLRDPRRAALPAGMVPVLAVCWLVGLAAMANALHAHREEVRDDAIRMTRGFYGVLRVYEGDVGEEDHYRSLYHGRISHGRQFMNPPLRTEPIAYYGPGSGPHATMTALRGGDGSSPLHLGVVGLGVGTLSSYARSGDTMRIHEINPQVEQAARACFHYLEDCRGDLSVVPGDARITLEQEAREATLPRLDALFVDAFSGDAIPMHLLTREAFEVYLRRLTDDGVLAIHITNFHLELDHPVRTVGEALGKQVVLVESDRDEWEYNYSAWAIITSNQRILDALRDGGLLTPWDDEEPQPILWTDDYSNLLQVLRWD